MNPLQYYTDYLTRILISNSTIRVELYKELSIMPAGELIKLIDAVDRQIADEKLDMELLDLHKQLEPFKNKK